MRACVCVSESNQWLFEDVSSHISETNSYLHTSEHHSLLKKYLCVSLELGFVPAPCLTYLSVLFGDSVFLSRAAAELSALSACRAVCEPCPPLFRAL